MIASRALRFTALAIGILGAGAAVAAGPALVVDADSGRVLYAERATDPWFPASITKLMTAYVALEAVRSGRLTFDSLLKVSENAASMPPSKMGFRPGTEVTLDNALKIIMVKSANDVAMVIAEGVGGSVEGFADMMNDTAWRLGMRESRWTNPHGLPDPAQYTSARDMAILGRALLRDFPERTDLYRLSAIQFGRRIMANHNGLIGRYPGADGMKTGFICSSGFNVVASATRDGRRLITVVMGSPSAAERTIKAADLFDRGFASFGWAGQSLDGLTRSGAAAPPDLRPVICGGRGRVPAEEDAQPALVGADAVNSPNANNPITASMAPAFSALAFAGGSIGAAPRRLGPRAPLQPVLVWTGPSPDVNLAESEEQRPAGLSRRKGAAKVARTAARALKADDSPAAKAFIATRPPSLLEDGDKNAKPKGAISPTAALVKPEPKPKLGAIRAKPEPKPKAAAKPKPQAPVHAARAEAAKSKTKAVAKPAPAAAVAQARPKPKVKSAKAQAAD